ncbi:MAG TPA: 2-phosphosulfolactate phosphatase, partial [Firmicutes bacterium]|nr:2-phosphosulfolactate phosphatase [Bacillota bacterium]
EKIIIAGIVNVSAVAAWLLEQERDVTIVCSGTEGRLSLDDIHCGGLLISNLFEPGFTPQLSDGVRLALQWFAANAGNAPYVLSSCTHGQRLIRQGFEDDVRWCAQIDAVPVVPIHHGTGFTLLTT